MSGLKRGVETVLAGVGRGAAAAALAGLPLGVLFVVVRSFLKSRAPGGTSHTIADNIVAVPLLIAILGVPIGALGGLAGGLAVAASRGAGHARSPWAAALTGSLLGVAPSAIMELRGPRRGGRVALDPFRHHRRLRDPRPAGGRRRDGRHGVGGPGMTSGEGSRPPRPRLRVPPRLLQKYALSRRVTPVNCGRSACFTGFLGFRGTLRKRASS